MTGGDEVEEVRSERVIHQPPTCIEFCPVDPTILVVGTYELRESDADSSTEEGTRSQLRTGRIELYRVRKKLFSPDFGVSECIDRYDFPDCAVLDLHFCPQHPTFFAVCTSTSRLVLFRLENVGCYGAEGRPIEPSILKAGSLQMIEDERVLATSFVWNPRPVTCSDRCVSLAATFSTGDIKFLEVRLDIKAGLCSYDDFRILRQASINPAHTLEAWTVAFTKLSHGRDDEHIILTGGDDSVLALHSFSHNLHPARLEANQLFQDVKSHGAGVTAILPIFDVSHVSPRTRAFVTGSYDENIRVFTIEDLPPYKRKVVAELPLGGGVWRLKKLSETLSEEGEGGTITCSVLILASCMHAGVRIIRIVRRQTGQKNENRFSWEAEVVGQYTKGHDSMCYGADSVNAWRLLHNSVQGDRCTEPASWPQRSADREDDYDPPQDFVVVSTSFYDKKICVWSYSIRG